ncbi:MAG: hypothetical protein ACRD0Y_00745 [Terriglobales bacterium]
MLTKKQRREYAAWLGRKSYRTRLEKFGIERLREIARENGKLGGRPRRGAKGGN